MLDLGSNQTGGYLDHWVSGDRGWGGGAPGGPPLRGRLLVRQLSRARAALRTAFALAAGLRSSLAKPIIPQGIKPRADGPVDAMAPPSRFRAR